MLKIASIALGLLCAADRVGAQVPVGLADSSVDRILELAARPHEIASVLRGRSGSVRPAKLDSLADKLALRVVSSARDGDKERDGTTEVLALSLAGARPVPGVDGIAYSGAAQRLIRIHQDSPNSASLARGSAIRSLARVVEFQRSLPYLRKVATSEDPTAGEAMRTLIIAATSGAVPGMTEVDRAKSSETLRELWEAVRQAEDRQQWTPESSRKGHPVPNKIARANLGVYARDRGWP